MALAKSAARLVRRMQQGEQGDGATRPEVSERPGCAYGMVTRRALEDLEKAFNRLEAKVNGVLVTMLLTLALEIWRSLR